MIDDQMMQSKRGWCSDFISAKYIYIYLRCLLYEVRLCFAVTSWWEMCWRRPELTSFLSVQQKEKHTNSSWTSFVSLSVSCLSSYDGKEEKEGRKMPHFLCWSHAALEITTTLIPLFLTIFFKVSPKEAPLSLHLSLFSSANLSWE